MSFAYNDALDDNTTAATEPSSDTGTAVLERPKAQERRADDGDADRFAHYVSRDRIAESRLTGRPVVALCGSAISWPLKLADLNTMLSKGRMLFVSSVA